SGDQIEHNLNQIEQNLNVGDSCVPELASSGLGLIPPINHQNDQCYLAYINQYGEIYLTLDLPNGGSVRIVFGRGYLDRDKGVVFTEQYTPDEMIITGDARAFFFNPLLNDFIKGIRDGLRALWNDGVRDFFDYMRAIDNANSMIKEGYFGSFRGISLESDEKDATTFMKHAIIGGYIATKMQKYDDNAYNQYDTIIGFWVSFWMEQSGIQMKIMPGYSGVPKETESSCLIDLANIVKAMILQESHFGKGKDDINKPDNDGMIGLMQVYKNRSGWDFITSDYAKYGKELNFNEYTDEKGHETKNKKALNPFNNIGIGVGHLYAKLTGSEKTYKYSTGERGAPTLKQWLDAAGHYNGSGPSGSYRQNIASIIFKGIDNREGCKNPMTPEYILEYYLYR
ncbi:hypothetical protein LLG10_02350, partial [bacterium]|nr:hypothetical protein [bacterium]